VGNVILSEGAPHGGASESKDLACSNKAQGTSTRHCCYRSTARSAWQPRI